MAARIKSDTSELEEIIANFQKFTTQSIPTLVRRHARILAVELANRTQPFSSGKGLAKSALADGKKAISNDLNKVFRSRESIQGIVDKTTNESIKEKLQKAVNSGNNKQIGDIFKAVGMVNDFELVSKSSLKERHKSQRSPRSGRTWSPKKNMYISTTGELNAYTKEVQKRVGFSKSAWSECAKQIGGTTGDNERGIPAFAKSKNHKADGAIIDGTKSSNPFVTMTSNVPWASRLLPDSEIKFAQYLVRNKMMKQANYIIRHAAKKNFQPESLIADE